MDALKCVEQLPSARLPGLRAEDAQDRVRVSQYARPRDRDLGDSDLSFFLFASCGRIRPHRNRSGARKAHLRLRSAGDPTQHINLGCGELDLFVSLPITAIGREDLDVMLVFRYTTVVLVREKIACGPREVLLHARDSSKT